MHNVDDKGCFAEFCDFGIDRVLARRHLALTAAPYDTPVALAAMNMKTLVSVPVGAPGVVDAE